MSKRIPVVTPPITVKVYPLLSEAVDRGIERGIRRIFKHDDTPVGEETLIERAENIHLNVMSEICELLDFGDE